MQELGIWVLVGIAVALSCGRIVSLPAPDHGYVYVAGVLILAFASCGVVRLVWLLIAAWF